MAIKRISKINNSYKIQVNSILTILKYGIYYDLWIGNGAVLKSSSQWQLKEFRK